MKSEWSGSRSKKRPLSTITVPQAHTPFSEAPASAMALSSSTSSRRPSVTSSAVYSSRAEHSPLTEHPFHVQKDQAWASRPFGHHLRVPQIELNSQPMACAITSFMDLARNMLSQGTPIQEIFGPERAVVDLLFRQRSPSDPHSVCHFAAEMCAGVKEIDMPAKLGMTFMYIYLMRVGGWVAARRLRLLLADCTSG